MDLKHILTNDEKSENVSIKKKTKYVPNIINNQNNSNNDSNNYSNKSEIDDLLEIIELMKADPKVDKNNIFSAGYSAGGFYVCFLAGEAAVNAGVSQYGVWGGPRSWNMQGYPVEYLSESSTPILALHGAEDVTQKLFRVEKAWDTAKDNGAPLEIHVYPDADLAWDRTGSTHWPYIEEVDKDSHKRTIEFFKKHMK